MFYLAPISLGFFSSFLIGIFMLVWFFSYAFSTVSKKIKAANAAATKEVSKSKTADGFTLYQIDALGISVSINTPDLTLLKHICIMCSGDVFEYSGDSSSAEPGITLPPGDTSNIYTNLDKMGKDSIAFTVKAEHTVIKVKTPKLSAVKHIYICNPEDTKVLEYTYNEAKDSANISYDLPDDENTP